MGETDITISASTEAPGVAAVAPAAPAPRAGAKVTLSDAQFAELQAKYSQHELRRTEVRQIGTVVLRNPSAIEYAPYQAQWAEKNGERIAYHNALLQWSVFPDRATLSAALERWPGLAMNVTIWRPIREICGELDAAEGKG